MSLFDIFGLGKKGGTGSTDSGRDSKKYYIIDGSTLDSSKSERTRLNPRNQMDILRRVSRFAKKEQIDVCVVFEGKALRDAPDGKKYQDVMVEYVAKSSEVGGMVAKLCSSKRGRNVLVITTDKEVEKHALGSKASLMHCTTFKKALEANGESGGGGRERSSGNRDRRRPNRRPRGGGGNSGGNNNNSNTNSDNQQQAAQKPKQKPAKKDADPVSELIDLV